MAKGSFEYYTGEDVRVADHVLSFGRKGIVKSVILPGTRDASDFSAPEGGVLVEEEWSNRSSLMLYIPPDGRYWEDLEFVKRGH